MIIFSGFKLNNNKITLGTLFYVCEAHPVREVFEQQKNGLYITNRVLILIKFILNRQEFKKLTPRTIFQNKI